MIFQRASSSLRLDPFTRLAMLGSVLGVGFLLSERMASSPLLAFAVLVLAVAGALWRIKVLQGERRDLPVNNVSAERLAKASLLTYASWIKAQLRGHDEGVDRVCLAVERGLRLLDPHRPIGAFLLVGPTGTGKTYFAELASRALFGEDRLITLALNMYKDAGDGELLLERLLEPLCEDPHRVILLDEIDKAHPAVLHSLYEILDKGRCRSRTTGRVVSFAGTVIFATSNSGVEGLRALRARRESALELPRGRALTLVSSTSRPAAAVATARSPALLAAEWIGGARDALATETAMDPAFLARWDDVILMDELPSFRAAEVACLTIARHWERHGLRVLFTSPELVLSLVRENREFSRYGVRQLQQLIRARSDGAILAARAQGFKVLTLGLSESGEFELIKGGHAA